MNATLPPELARYQEIIKKIASDEGLDFFEVIFEMLDFVGLNEVAAYGGFPTRYPHWRHGMSYEQLDKGYRYGLSKIYELVINNDPCYAYLLSSNSEVDNKLVIAHVYGHCDFFKNNVWFAHTNRKMMDVMANHATRVRKLIDRFGQDAVEDALERALSLENLVDLFAPFRTAPSEARKEDEEEAEGVVVRKLRSKDYMDRYINPPELMEEERRKKEAELREKHRRVPREPVRDVMGFLLEHAPLERHEWEILDIVRKEALYFVPQRLTKIMNEGWATYWHRKIMAEYILTDEEVVDYADTMSGSLAEGSSLNPYKLGLELWLDIEDRWNKGRHGLDYARCDDMERLSSWDTEAMAGKEQIFFCRRVHNDLTFIDEFLTPEFCDRKKLFVYRWNPRTRRKEIATRDFPAVKEQLMRQLANGGAPVIDVVDSNFENRGELYLVHRWDGVDLRTDYATATLRHVQALWRRPVCLETTKDGQRQLIRTDGRSEEIRELGVPRGEGP